MAEKKKKTGKTRKPIEFNSKDLSNIAIANVLLDYSDEMRENIEKVGELLEQAFPNLFDNKNEFGIAFKEVAMLCAIIADECKTPPVYYQYACLLLEEYKRKVTVDSIKVEPLHTELETEWKKGLTICKQNFMQSLLLGITNKWGKVSMVKAQAIIEMTKHATVLKDNHIFGESYMKTLKSRMKPDSDDDEEEEDE